MLPDYFLDDAEKFRDEWVAPSNTGGSSIGQMFDKIRPLINQETISSISAVYKFVITEETPGVCGRVCGCVWCVCGRDGVVQWNLF